MVSKLHAKHNMNVQGPKKGWFNYILQRDQYVQSKIIYLNDI